MNLKGITQKNATFSVLAVLASVLITTTACVTPIASAEDDKPANLEIPRDQANSEEDNPDKDEIAKELANPNTPLTSLKFQFQYFSFNGDLPRADNQDMLKVYFQPTLPSPNATRSRKVLWLAGSTLGVQMGYELPLWKF